MNNPKRKTDYLKTIKLNPIRSMIGDAIKITAVSGAMAIVLATSASGAPLNDDNVIDIQDWERWEVKNAAGGYVAGTQANKGANGLFYGCWPDTKSEYFSLAIDKNTLTVKDGTDYKTRVQIDANEVLELDTYGGKNNFIFFKLEDPNYMVMAEQMISGSSLNLELRGLNSTSYVKFSLMGATKAVGDTWVICKNEFEDTAGGFITPTTQEGYDKITESSSEGFTY